MFRVTLSTLAVFLLALLSVNVVTAGSLEEKRKHHPHHAEASPTPNCFTCPPTDNLGFAVADHSVDSSGVLFCSYPAVAGENPNDFFCTYSTSGTLAEDHNAGLCPPSAVAGPGGATRKRQTIVDTLKRRAEARAAQPQPSRPEFMTTRGTLKKKRRAN